MISSQGDDVLAGLVLDGIFDEAQGSLKYILGQVVLKLRKQDEQLQLQATQLQEQEQMMETMKESKEESKKLAAQAAEAHGREILEIMKNITDAMNARIVDINQTMATLVYNIQGFEMKVSEQSEAQKRAEEEYEARMKKQLDQIKEEQAASTAQLLERDQEMEAKEAANIAKLQANEDALKHELEVLKRKQIADAKAAEERALAERRSHDAPVPKETPDSGNVVDVDKRVAEIEAKLKHDQEKNMARMRQENERIMNLERERMQAAQAAEREREREREEAARREQERAAAEAKAAAKHKPVEGETPEQAKERKRKALAAKWERLQQLMDPAEMQKYRDAFRLFDVDGSGSVNVDEVDSMLKSMGINVPKDQILILIGQVDLDGSGEVDEQEFIMMMASAETSPEWQSIRKRVSDLSREKVDPAKSIGNRLKELEAFIHQAEAKFRKASLQGAKIVEVEKKLSELLEMQQAKIERLDTEMDKFADKFESVEKTHGAFNDALSQKEDVERALKTIGRVAVLEKDMKKKLERSDIDAIKNMIWTDMSGLLEDATKDAIQRAEFDEKMLTKADAVKLGMKADQDLVDAVVERLEKRVEAMYGDVELIKMNEEAEELHREEQRKKEKEIVTLMSVLDNRVKLTSENVEEDLNAVQTALAGKADRTKVVEILQQLDSMGSNTEALERIKRRLGDKANKIDFDRVMNLARRLGKNVKSLDDSMKGLSDVDGAAVKCLACDRPLANLSESTLLSDGPSFTEEPNPPLGKPKGYLLHPLHRSGALRPLGLQYRVQRPRTTGAPAAAGGTRRTWGGALKQGGRPYSGTPLKSGFSPSRNTRSLHSSVSSPSIETVPGMSPETHLGSPNQRHLQQQQPRMPNKSRSAASMSTLSHSRGTPSVDNSFGKMNDLKRYVQGCDGRYYVTDSV